MTKLGQEIIKRNLSELKDVVNEVGVDRKVLLRGEVNGWLKTYSIAGSKRKYYKLDEVREFLENNTASDKVVRINTKCHTCGRFFTYGRILECTEFLKEEIEAKKRKPSFEIRKYCDACFSKSCNAWRIGKTNSEESKQKVSRTNRRHWASKSLEQRKAIGDKISTAKTLNWATPKGREKRKIMSKVLSERMSQYWEDERLRKEFGKKVGEFWSETEGAKSDLSDTQHEAWNEVWKQIGEIK